MIELLSQVNKIQENLSSNNFSMKATINTDDLTQEQLDILQGISTQIFEDALIANRSNGFRHAYIPHINNGAISYG